MSVVLLTGAVPVEAQGLPSAIERCLGLRPNQGLPAIIERQYGLRPNQPLPSRVEEDILRRCRWEEGRRQRRDRYDRYHDDDGYEERYDYRYDNRRSRPRYREERF
jgi:hypothetical protein